METTYQKQPLADQGKQNSTNIKQQKITPFLWFDGKAEEAMNFYTSTFKNSSIIDTMPGPDGKVMSGTFQLNGYEMMALNAGPMFTFSPAVSFFVTCENEQEIDTLWAKLSPGGSVLMELEKYPFSEKYGWLQDQFAVSWQLSIADTSQQISPSLLFVGNQKGKAEEAIQFYTSLFPDSSIAHIERYGDEDQDPTGTVKYASFSLNGQEFSAMDSSMAHEFTFTPAISFFVKCETQPEIDSYWDKLSQGGEKQRCGWVKDKYGVSWQIVPPVLGKLLSDPDKEKSRRVMNAMLQMDKLIIADLERAYNNNSSDQAAGSQQGDLVITRELHLPIDKVWQAWTDPETCKKWWGPEGFTCPHASIDLRVGGKSLTCMRSPEGEEFWSTGMYKEIIPQKKLVTTDSFSDEKGNVVPAASLNMPGNWPMELLVTVTFEEKGGNTLMELKHQGLPMEILENCRTGWQQSFDKMEKNLKEKMIL